MCWLDRRYANKVGPYANPRQVNPILAAPCTWLSNELWLGSPRLHVRQATPKVLPQACSSATQERSPSDPGCFARRSETYQYYQLPFCTPKGGKEYKLENLGEVLEGDRQAPLIHKTVFADLSDRQQSQVLDRVQWLIQTQTI